MPNSAILSWVVEFNPLQNLSTIAMRSVYPESSMRSLNSSMYADNQNTTQTLEYTKDKYNAKIRNKRVSPKVPPTTYIG
jgi:hypothetical protein